MRTFLPSGLADKDREDPKVGRGIRDAWAAAVCGREDIYVIRLPATARREAVLPMNAHRNFFIRGEDALLTCIASM